MKSVLVGASQTIFVERGHLVLGRWQGIFFCEFDGPRERRLQVKVVADPPDNRAGACVGVRRCVRVLVPMTSLGIIHTSPVLPNEVHVLQFSHWSRFVARFAPYVSGVCREIQNHRKLYSSAGIELAASAAAAAQVDTVYIGGGTPSLLDPRHLANILDTIRATFRTRFPK